MDNVTLECLRECPVGTTYRCKGEILCPLDRKVLAINVVINFLRDVTVLGKIAENIRYL